MARGRILASLFAVASTILASPLAAQDATAADSGNTAASGASSSQVFEPTYFAQFAPRSALDMVEQIPGFQISGPGGGGQSNTRGFGQADENVLVNGERLITKSIGIRDQLRRIPASSVVRIELREGASLDLPGLTGLVANVLVKRSGLSGQFKWEGALRTTEVDPEWYGGEVSLAGTSGALDYTLAVENNNNRFGGTGPTIFRDANGILIERQETVSAGAFDHPRISGSVAYDFGGGISAALTGYWARTFFDRVRDEQRFFPDGSVIDRFNGRDGGAPDYELAADFTFPLGPGRLKLIGLEAWDGDASGATLIDTPRTGAPAIGTRFASEGGAGERIARFEYSLPFLGGDWQLAGEAAFNRLDQISSLLTLDETGSFIETPFPEGTGGVKEDRYEVILNVTRRLTDQIALQASLGGESSRIRQTGLGANSRRFERPKGSFSVSWQSGVGLDISMAIERRVGQLNFGDFLASVALEQDNENAGNNELVPDQTWEAKFEIAKSLGAWGSTTLTIERRWIDDYVDLILLDDGSEARGNIDKARRSNVDWTTTLKFDPLGWRGAQLDLGLKLEEGEIRDPATGELRDFSGGSDRGVRADFRHDIPGSQIAWGTNFSYNRARPRFRASEKAFEFEGPSFLSAFIEHKDVLGTTVNLSVANLLGGRERFVRTVYDGSRDEDLVLFTEDRSYRIGPIFRASVSGNF